MLESFTIEPSKPTESCEQGAFSRQEDGSLKCLLEVFSAPERQEKRSERENEKPVPVKDVPGANVAVEGNQYYLNYRGLHLPSFNATNPDGSAAQPYVGIDGKIRADGKLQGVTDEKGALLGVDGKPVFDAMGLRRLDDAGNPVQTRLDDSEPLQMKRAIEAKFKEPLTDEGRAAYGKMIESSDKLDRVEMARSVEANEKYVMAHTTAFLFETAYRQLKQTPGSEEALKAKDAELKAKPVLAEQVRRVREGEALDEQAGALLGSSIDTRAAYMSRLLRQDSVREYMSSRTKGLENDVNVVEAKRMVTELSHLNPDLSDQLLPTAKLLGINDLRSRK